MASWGSWASWGALLAGLALSAGCNGEKERYPPPQFGPGTTSGDATGGGAGDAAGGGGTGGGTGGGSTSTGSTTTGTLAEANLCECAFSMVDSTACGACVNDATAPGKTCEQIENECKSDASCKGLLDCRLPCVGKPDAEKVTCIQGCYASVDLSDPMNHAFVDVMDCLCDNCAIKCAPSMAIACP